MKNLYIIIVGLLLMGATSSCNDFLKEKPKGNMQLSDYFINEYHAKAAVNKLYRSGVPDFYDAGVYTGAKIIYGSYLSGLIDNEYKGQEVIAQYSQSLTIDSKNISLNMDELWDGCYEAIGRANTAIKYIPTIDPLKISEPARAQTIAQAKFFRALNYFHLVKTYGDVPLIIEPYEEAKDMYDARNTSADVYALIVKDLTEALTDGDSYESLPNVNFTKENRITKATAQTLLANVYLQMSGYPIQKNQYADAATAARKVIIEGKHQLTQHKNQTDESAYNILRTENNLPEYVYAREFGTEISRSYWTQLSFPVAAGSWDVFQYTLVNLASNPVEQLLNVYDPAKDLRIQEKQFMFKEYDLVSKKGTPVKGTLDKPAPWFYYNQKAMLETGVSDKSFPIYRYAEVLLIAAEAIAQSEGVTDEAAGYLAQVRARAYTNETEATIKAGLLGLSKQAFVEEVWTERLREMLLEHKIWDDVQRTRKYPTTDKANKGKVNFVDVVGAKNPWGATFQEKHLLWPISANEIQRNPALTQNTGY